MYSSKLIKYDEYRLSYASTIKINIIFRHFVCYSLVGCLDLVLQAAIKYQIVLPKR